MTHELTYAELDQFLDPQFQKKNRLGMIKYLRQMTGSDLKEAIRFYEEHFEQETVVLSTRNNIDYSPYGGEATLSPATDHEAELLRENDTKLRIERVQKQIDLIGEQVSKLNKMMEQAGLKALEQDAKGIF